MSSKSLLVQLLPRVLFRFLSDASPTPASRSPHTEPAFEDDPDRHDPPYADLRDRHVALPLALALAARAAALACRRTSSLLGFGLERFTHVLVALLELLARLVAPRTLSRFLSLSGLTLLFPLLLFPLLPLYLSPVTTPKPLLTLRCTPAAFAPVTYYLRSSSLPPPAPLARVTSQQVALPRGRCRCTCRSARRPGCAPDRGQSGGPLCPRAGAHPGPESRRRRHPHSH